MGQINPLRIAILDDYQGVALQSADWSVLPAGSDVQVFRDHVDDEQALVARLREASVVVAMRERTPFGPSLLAQLPALKLLVTTGRRNAAIDVAAAREHGIVVSGTEGLPHPTAELTWGLILSLLRRIPQEDHATRAGAWQTTLGRDLAGKTLGVLGLGRLGTRVAKVGRAFDMRVIAWSPHLTEARAREGHAQYVSREVLFEESDVLSVHLVLGEGTRGLVGEGELARMKRSAYLINTARGPIVDEGALIAALSGGRLAGAGLDVFDREPLPLDHPLRQLPNTVITPHLGYVTEDTYRVFFRDVVEDIVAFLRGTPLRVL
ncbi:MAG: D-2-hydroxyacid dehydrogenase family protein [Polyangiales bacterium]